MLGSKAFDPSDTGLLCTACSRISALLRSVLNMCHWHIAPAYEQAHVGSDILTLVA